MRPYQVKTVKDGKQWGWNLKHSNGKIEISGRGLDSRAYAKAFGERVTKAMALYDHSQEHPDFWTKVREFFHG